MVATMRVGNTMIDIINAVITLFMTGDYAGWMRPVLGEEDSALVDIILAMSGR